MVLINFLQKVNLFPKYRRDTDYKKIHQFIATLIGEPTDNIKKAQERAGDYFNDTSKSPKQKRIMLKKLSKLKPIIALLNDSELSESFNELLMDKFDTY